MTDWNPTSYLRWECHGLHGPQTLQQLWVRDREDLDLDCWVRDEEWRQVQFVDVSQPDAPLKAGDITSPQGTKEDG